MNLEKKEKFKKQKDNDSSETPKDKKIMKTRRVYYLSSVVLFVVIFLLYEFLSKRTVKTNTM